MSNIQHRPVGLGIQGLCDVFQLLELPYGSDMAVKLSSDISETMYYHALKASNALAKDEGLIRRSPHLPRVSLRQNFSLTSTKTEQRRRTLTESWAVKSGPT